jgi:hypothetical protein
MFLFSNEFKPHKIWLQFFIDSLNKINVILFRAGSPKNQMWNLIQI